MRILKEAVDVDVSMFKPTPKIMAKLRDYYDRLSKINVRAITGYTKALTYLYGMILFKNNLGGYDRRKESYLNDMIWQLKNKASELEVPEDVVEAIIDTAKHDYGVNESYKKRKLRESTETKPNKEQFEAYVTIQKSGITNMFNTKVVCDVANEYLGVDLTRDNCLYIFKHYQELMDEYKLNESYKKRLKERKWDYHLSSGKELRKAIENEDYQGVINGIKACYKEMLDNGVIDEHDYESWTDALDWIDLDDEDAEESIDYELDNLYDACDNLGCWVELNESRNKRK